MPEAEPFECQPAPCVHGRRCVGERPEPAVVPVPFPHEAEMEQREVVDELVEGVLLRAADHFVAAQESALAQFFEADGDVEFSEDVPPQLHETVALNDGFFSESEVLKGLVGTVEMVNGKKRATVILDKIGCFKFTLSVHDLKRPT